MGTQASPDKARQKPYVALVYFHGIGQQRRYEEVSRLIDGLNRYAPETKDKNDISLNQEHVLQFEPTRPDLEESLGRPAVGYVPLLYKGKEYRLYEAYYADLFAGGLRPTEVFFWLLKLSIRPVKILLTRWRELPGLRRAVLLGDWVRRRKNASDRNSLDREVDQLLSGYDDFVKSHEPAPYSEGNIRQDIRSFLKRFFSEGRYGQFSKHLPQYLKNHAGKNKNSNSKQVRNNARRWRWQFVRVQRTIILLVLTALLSIGLALLGVGTFVSRIPARPFLENVLIGGIILLLLWGIRAFLRNYVGDLYFWTSYEETSEKYRKREAVVSRCMGYLKHVLLDSNCDRIVLVGHSMGTTVAHATLQRLGRAQANSKSNGTSQKKLRLEKIQHLVTLASVIDKVYYLFETVTSKSYTFNRIIETTRGDLGTPPFAGPKTSPIPRIHWINFWDRADVASSALYTPANYEFKPHYVVDNFEVAGSCFPDPSSAHLDYFNNPIVLGAISEVFFDNKYSFVDLPEGATEMQIQELFIGGQEKQHRFTNVFQSVVSLTPWLILFYGIASYFIPTIAGIPFFTAFGLYILAIAFLGLSDWAFRYWRKRLAESRSESEPDLMRKA